MKASFDGPEIEGQPRRAWPLPPVPVTVFTALVPIPEEWVLANDARIDVWLAAHRSLALRIPGATHVVVDSANHVSILDEPVLQATILDVVEAARRQLRSN